MIKSSYSFPGLFRVSCQKKTKPGRKLSFILIIAIINLTSCDILKYYTVSNPINPSSTIFDNFQSQNKSVFVHFDNMMWQLTSIKVFENIIYGEISENKMQTKYPETNPYKSNRYRKNLKIDESWVLNEVHLHISQYNEIDSVQIYFPFEAVSLIQIYDKDNKAYWGSRIFVLKTPLILIILFYFLFSGYFYGAG